MEVRPTNLDGVLLIEPKVHRDERGLFVEVYRRGQFHQLGIRDEFVQANQSRSARGVLRGIHYQDLSAPMAKLVRCTGGRVFDVAVDLRLGSPRFGQWYGIELTADNMRQLYIPVGFGHGFLAISEGAELQYMCSAYYAPAAEGTIAWNDPEVAVAWPIKNPILPIPAGQAPRRREYRSKPAFHYPSAVR